MIRIVLIGCCLLAAMGAPAGVADIIVRSDEHGSRHSRRHRGSRPLIVLSKRLVIDVETNQFEYQCGPAPREIDRRRAPQGTGPRRRRRRPHRLRSQDRRRSRHVSIAARAERGHALRDRERHRADRGGRDGSCLTGIPARRSKRTRRARAEQYPSLPVYISTSRSGAEQHSVSIESGCRLDRSRN
jgi:hypothetical protein